MEKMYKPGEVAKMLRIKDRAMYIKIKNGEIKVIRLNCRAIRIPETALQEYLAGKGMEVSK